MGQQQHSFQNFTTVFYCVACIDFFLCNSFGAPLEDSELSDITNLIHSGLVVYSIYDGELCGAFNK